MVDGVVLTPPLAFVVVIDVVFDVVFDVVHDVVFEVVFTVIVVVVVGLLGFLALADVSGDRLSFGGYFFEQNSCASGTEARGASKP